MTSRTTTTNITFRREFVLPDMVKAFPPGTYLVETDEESLDNISSLAYRRVATRIHWSKPGLIEVFTIDPKGLQDALARDSAA